MKAYKYKLKVSMAVAARFGRTLDVCRELYNAALQERRDAWRVAQVSVNYYDQQLLRPAEATPTHQTRT